MIALLCDNHNELNHHDRAQFNINSNKNNAMKKDHVIHIVYKIRLKKCKFWQSFITVKFICTQKNTYLSFVSFVHANILNLEFGHILWYCINQSMQHFKI